MGTLYCDNHPDRAASFLVTNLDAGESLTLCSACYVDHCYSIAQALYGQLEQAVSEAETAANTLDAGQAAPFPAAEIPASTEGTPNEATGDTEPMYSGDTGTEATGQLPGAVRSRPTTKGKRSVGTD